MNLRQRLSKLKKAPAGTPRLSDLAPMSQAEHRAMATASLRRFMRSQGHSDAEIDAYLAEHQPGGIAKTA